MKAEDFDNVCVLRLEHDLHGTEVVSFRSAVEHALDERNVIDIVVDCEICEFVDSAGLEALLWARRRCDERFGHFTLAHVGENPMRILQLTRLNHRFTLSDDVAAGMKVMR